MTEEKTLQPGSLYVVGTPIGNLGDLSPRALETLSQADFIAAEDTRVTLKLLNHFGVKKPLFSYFEHNKATHGEQILRRLRDGETCALVSDAGMPAVSDPGEALIASCAAENIPVYVVPGPTAAVSALAVSGLPTGRFTFEGFLPVEKKARRQRLEALSREERTMILYEAPHKLVRTLEDLSEALGEDRPLALVRELTKVHEEVWRGTLSQALTRCRTDAPRGEFVLVLGGGEPAPAGDALTLEEAVALARRRMEEGLSAADAAREAAQLTGRRKNEIYRLLALQEE